MNTLYIDRRTGGSRYPVCPRCSKPDDGHTHDGPSDLCRCGAPGEPPHPCPYAEEISGNDTPCNCCHACASKCALDI